MDRREFLKNGLAGLFGVFLAKLGMVKAEEPETADVLFEDKTTDTLFGYPIVWVEETEAVFKYRRFFAARDSGLVESVLCDGRDITSICTAFYGPEQPGKSGIGVAYVVDDPAQGDENGNIIQHVVRGTIEWREYK